LKIFSNHTQFQTLGVNNNKPTPQRLIFERITSVLYETYRIENEKLGGGEHRQQGDLISLTKISIETQTARRSHKPDWPKKLGGYTDRQQGDLISIFALLKIKKVG
jgi:hypothetical protein